MRAFRNQLLCILLITIASTGYCQTPTPTPGPNTPSQFWLLRNDGVVQIIPEPTTPDIPWYEDYDFASKGVVAYWPLDGNTEDVSGNNHHGTPYDIEYVSGAFRQGVYTNGEAGSYVNLGDVDLPGDFTISLWISLSESLAVGQDVAFVNKRYLTSNLDQNYYVGLMPDGTHRPRALYQGTEVSAVSQVNPGNLYHITYVREGGQHRIYVNGDLEGVRSITTANSLNNADATLGGIYDQNGIHAVYNGMTDDVVFFDHTLTPGQIELLSKDRDKNGVADYWESPAPVEVNINWNQWGGSGPPARTDHAMVYDSLRNVTVLYAGTSTTAKQDTWEFDGSKWTQISTSANPGLASQHAIAYDPTRGKTIFFQGNRTPATWEYDGADWTAISTAQIPNCIYSSRMAYFPPLGKVVLFGGSESGVPLNETWTYDGNAWTQILPPGNPPALTRHGMGYDSNRQILVLFGGFNEDGAQAETWEFDGSEWKQVITNSSPPGGCCKSMAFDTQLDRMVLCTGGTYQNWHNQTWVYDGIDWEQLDTTTQPSARYEAEMVYDSENQMLVYYGGFNGSHQGDTWLSDDNISPIPLESKIVFTRSSDNQWHPWICNLDGSNPQQLSDIAIIGYPRISQGRVIFLSEGYEAQGAGIYTMLATPGSTISKISNTDNVYTANGWTADGLDISPDASRIVWAGPEPGDYYQNHNLYVANNDGSGKTRIQRNTSKHYTAITWGDDERILLSQSDVGNAYSQRIHSINPDGSNLTLEVSFFAQNAHAGGPNNQVVMTKEQANPYLIIFNNDFTEEQTIPGPVYLYSACWHPTENKVIAWRYSKIFSVDVSTGTQTDLFPDWSDIGAGDCDHWTGTSLK